MKKILLFLACTLFVTSMYAQKVNFTLTGDGTFVNADNRTNYAIISVPGMSAEELYYAFLITLRNKCVNSLRQMDVVENRVINLYDVESTYGLVSGYKMFYRFQVEVKDGMLRIISPSVSYFEDTDRDGKHVTFATMRRGRILQFNDNGIPKANSERIITLNGAVNDELNSIIETALNVYKW